MRSTILLKKRKKALILKKLTLLGVLSGSLVAVSACGSDYPYSTNLKKALDLFNDSYIQKISTAGTFFKYLNDDKNKAVFDHEALYMFGFQSVNQYKSLLTIPNSIFSNISAASQKT